MGIAYLSEDDRIDNELFSKITNNSLKNTQQNNNILTKISLGVDWGKTESWVVLGGSDANDKGKFKVVYVERINNEILEKNGLKPREENHQIRVEHLANLFKVNILVNDANGLGIDKNSYLNNKFGKRSFGAWYDTQANLKQMLGQNRKNSKITEANWNENANKVTINRTFAFKQVLSLIKNENIELPALDPIIEIFHSHIKACNIITRKDETTGKETQNMISTGADHLCHALVYCYLGWKKVTKTNYRPVGLIDSDIWYE